MARIPRVLGLTVLGVAVLAATASIEAAPGEPSSGPASRVIRVAQKPKAAKKKVRGKRATPAEDPNKPAPEAIAPSNSETAPDDGELKFSRDIAPILVANCGDCHMKAAKNGGNFDMTSFRKLMDGSPKKKKVIEPGKPEESHLVLQIKGEEDPKMPRGNNRNLSDEAIAKIERWVKAGALLDAGKDPKAPLASYASSPEDIRKAQLAKLTPEQRDKQVETVGKDRWKKASPKTTPEVISGKHFILFSTLPKTRAPAALKKLDDQFEGVRSLLGPEATEWGEKASLFVFNDAGSYGEFVQANEQRQVEAGDVATARFSTPEPYVAVVDPLGGRDAPEPAASAVPKKTARPRRGRPGAAGGDEVALGGPERTLAGLLTEQFAIGVTSAKGRPPRWVTLGLGALVASRVEPSSPYYRKIRHDAVELYNIGWASKANDALGDQEKTETVRAVGFAIFDWVLSHDRAALSRLVSEMNAGAAKLDDALALTLTMSRPDFLVGSGQFVIQRYGR